MGVGAGAGPASLGPAAGAGGATAGGAHEAIHGPGRRRARALVPHDAAAIHHYHRRRPYLCHIACQAMVALTTSCLYHNISASSSQRHSNPAGLSLPHHRSNGSSNNNNTS